MEPTARRQAPLRAASKATKAETRLANLRLTLQVVMAAGSTSRADIARQTGLTRATVSALVAELIADDLLVEAGLGASAGGKPPTLLEIDDRPEVRAVMEHLATADAAMGWIEAGGFISPNSAIPPEAYSDYASSAQAEILADATVLRFDASDSMPAEVGQGSFWSGMVEWVAAEGANTEQVFADIEASWPS